MILEARAILDTDKIERLIKRVGDLLENSVENDATGLECGASLAHHGLLGSVKKMTLRHVDRSSVYAQHLASLVSCVTDLLIIDVSGCDLVSILTSLKCKKLKIRSQNLGREETQALVQAMESGVEEVRLCGEVTLDIESLTEYSGKGVCSKLMLYYEAWDRSGDTRYREELKTWARSRNWRVDLTRNGRLDYVVGMKFLR